jgi:hypothetical protein
VGLISLVQARAQVRVEDDYPVEQLQSHIDGAEDAAQGYLNRRIYETGQDLQDARLAYPAAVAAAVEERDRALAEAALIDGAEARAAATRVARVIYTETLAAADRCIHGVVVNPSLISAMLLTIGHLYANRSDVVVGAPAVELPQGAKSLLRPYRRVMMP